MSIYDDLKMDKIKDIRLHVEDNSEIMYKIVNEIVEPYVKDLDKYVLFIKTCLKDGENPPSDSELEDFCMNLSTYIYFAGGMCEQLGIRDDIAKAVYKEVYNTARDNHSGTINDKNSRAELETQQEQLVSICYNRAYKIVKSKIDNAQELLSSCKKVLTRRMNEYQLTQLLPH